MKLLIITQKVDMNDDVLGFMHGWVEEFSKNCEKVVVICLQKGEHDLTNNVKVLSLGKEHNNFQFFQLRRIWSWLRQISCGARRSQTIYHLLLFYQFSPKKISPGLI